MGQMSGTNLIRQLRADKVQIPIIMISGDPAVEKEAAAAGATIFFEKNTDIEGLEQALQQFLRD
jgi:FixJ family two-component response regulator